MEELKNLMIDARVSVLDAKMVELDKKNRKITLDKEASLPFDMLVKNQFIFLIKKKGLYSFSNNKISLFISFFSEKRNY